MHLNKIKVGPFNSLLNPCRGQLLTILKCNLFSLCSGFSFSSHFLHPLSLFGGKLAYNPICLLLSVFPYAKLLKDFLLLIKIVQKALHIIQCCLSMRGILSHEMKVYNSGNTASSHPECHSLDVIWCTEGRSKCCYHYSPKISHLLSLPLTDLPVSLLGHSEPQIRPIEDQA